MTILFFTLSLIFLWLSYNLYYPVYRHPKGAVLSFLMGWLTGELALHHIAWQITLVFLMVWNGAVSGLFGGLGFVFCLVAWAGMAYFYLSSSVVKSDIEQGLQQGLGPHYRASINKIHLDHFPLTPDYKKIRDPRHNLHEDVERLKDVAFGDFEQKLDIYRSRQLPQNSPVLFQIHGGAWTEKMGSKNEQAIPLMSHMALRNWICVSIDYRLSPGATFPEHIIDCKQALVWVKKHIAEFGGNPDFIVVTGGSAGGHLSSLVALTPNDPLFQPGFEEEDTNVQGAVPFYGVYDFTDSCGLQKHDAQIEMFESSIFKLARKDNLEQYQQVSPLFRIHADAPPFLIIHGDKDTLVPVEEARVFAERLREQSDKPVAYAEISGGQHAFDMFPSVRSEYVKHGVERFLAHLYSQYEGIQQKPGSGVASSQEQA